MNVDAIPFKELKQWCVYKLETVNGNRTKVPYQISGHKASSTDPHTWTSFSPALSAYENLDGFNGICFMLLEDNGVVFVDLDNCIKDGVVEEWALEIVTTFASYTEKSQSGKGLHILAKATKPGLRCRTESYPHDVEIYDHARQCCLTGDILDGHDKVELRQEELNELYQEVFAKVDTNRSTKPDTSGTTRTWSMNVSDEALILKAKLAKNGVKFEALWNGSFQGYPSQSEADQALMNMLAFWTGDATRMESLFSQSGLGQRSKWRNRLGYREDTIYKALHDVREFYSPPPVQEADEYSMPSNPKLTLNLEVTNLLKQFIAFGDEMGDAYPDYWFIGGLELLAIINDRRTFVKISTETVYPNIYANALGKSGESHKSTMVRRVEKIIELLNDMGIYNEAATEGSPEGWLEGMAECGGHAYCNQDESANYLGKLQKKDYMSGMTDMLNKVYDGATISKRNSKKRKDEPNRWKVERPYYNQLYATTPVKFSFVTTSMDIHSGFWVRFLHTYPNYEMEKFTPLGEATPELDNLEKVIVDRLKKIQKELKHPFPSQCKLEDWDYYKKWQTRWHQRTVKMNDDFMGQLMARYNIYALKLGMLFTMGRVDFVRDGMSISAEHMKEACRLIDEYFVPHALAVRDLIGEGAAKDANLIIRIETVLRVNKGRLTHRALCKTLKVSKKLLDEALDTMEYSGVVTTKDVVSNHGGGKSKTVFLNQEEDIPTVFSEWTVGDSRCTA